MPRRRRLSDELRRVRPELGDPDLLIRAGRVLVEGRYLTNPASLVLPGSSIVVEAPGELRGEAKLRAALDGFGVPVGGRVALDVGAAAGGFTKVLLSAGARRVYAVDAGHGQLLGSLRQDPRVVNLEATNLADLDRRRVPEPVDLVTLDLSYLALADAVPQLRGVALAPAADLVGLVKPMFELHLSAPPADPRVLFDARRRAVAGVQTAGWDVTATMESPVPGARGAQELLLHARRSLTAG